MSELHFLYHELRPEPSSYSYVVSCPLFEEHCKLFARRLASRSDGTYRPNVTFDDGHRSDLLFAAPRLEQAGLKGHFFITAGWTGRRSAYMDWGELRELSAQGHQIGAHGMSHKLLTQCSDAELVEELEGSRRSLEDALGFAVTTMSLPGGRADRRVLEACRRSGYEQIYTSVPEAALLAESPFEIGRVNLQGSTTVEWLARVLEPRSGLLQKLRRADRLKTTAKQVLGDALYARLWALGNRHEEGPSEATHEGAAQ